MCEDRQSPSRLDKGKVHIILFWLLTLFQPVFIPGGSLRGTPWLQLHIHTWKLLTTATVWPAIHRSRG